MAKRERKPIVAHPSEFIADELEARKWSPLYLAIRIHWKEIASTQLALEMYEALGAERDANHHLGDLAAQLDDAFGVTAGTFAALERGYINGAKGNG
jgi:hypothetical protein